MKVKVIITGATGMVGEGVLLECLQNPGVESVLIINRRHYDLKHAKLKELLIPDFFCIEDFKDQLSGYDACFFCAGVSSIGMNEADYHHATYDLTLHFAEVLAAVNPGMVFDYVSGASTDSSEKGRMMWARVKGKTENALMRLPFKRAYNFRPGLMKPTEGQKSLKRFYKIMLAFFPLFKLLMSSRILTLQQVGRAMINTVTKGYPKQILEIPDIKRLAES